MPDPRPDLPLPFLKRKCVCNPLDRSAFFFDFRSRRFSCPSPLGESKGRHVPLQSSSRKVNFASIVSCAERLKEGISTCQTHDPPRSHVRIVIDLGAIRHFSSEMLGQSIRTQREIDQTQGALRLRRLDPRVHHLFKIRRLEPLFTIFDRDVDSRARLKQESSKATTHEKRDEPTTVSRVVVRGSLFRRRDRPRGRAVWRPSGRRGGQCRHTTRAGAHPARGCTGCGRSGRT